MPELPEVETVKEVLKKQILNKKILDIKLYYDSLIEYPDVDLFKKQIVNQTILDIKRRGKWLVFVLNDYYLLRHLRMEGKFFIRNNDFIGNHDHISFKLNGCNLIYNDTRKFGKMHLIPK